MKMLKQKFIVIVLAVMSLGVSIYSFQSVLASPPDRCETANQPSIHSACSYAPGSNANSPGCFDGDQRLCNGSDFSPANAQEDFAEEQYIVTRERVP